MTSQNEHAGTFTVDSLDEFEVEMVAPSNEQAHPASTHAAAIVGNVDTNALLLVQEMLDELLADSSYWESSPRTAFEAFSRLRDKLKQRIGSPASVNGATARS